MRSKIFCFRLSELKTRPRTPLSSRQPSSRVTGPYKIVSSSNWNIKKSNPHGEITSKQHSLKIEISNTIQTKVAELGLTSLLSLWLIIYLAIGISFSIIYHNFKLLNYGATPDTYGSLYFSFITQATVGYGDITPINAGRWLSILQTIIGSVANAALLGLFVAKLLIRPSPISFSPVLIYEPKSHIFWTRFVTIDSRPLLNMSLTLELYKPLASEYKDPSGYDVARLRVTAPWSTLSYVRTAWNMSVKTVSNGGIIRQSRLVFDDLLTPSPYDFAEGDVYSDHPNASGPDRDAFLTVVVSGTLSITNASFIEHYIYGIDDIVCGSFRPINSNRMVRLEGHPFPLKKRLKLYRARVGAVKQTSVQECSTCNFHPSCPFEVARLARGEITTTRYDKL